ncbi:MAG: hypothetical protein ACD_50C00203G0002 [uncultured bacterium]|nr:MAG: hypothetical protein ACD_50C00203G0002 [uncultured bacterium]
MLRVSFPSTKYLSKKYLNYIVNEDGNGALGLSRRNCEIFLKGDIEKHIALYGGKQIKNLEVNVENGMGSDDEIQFSRMTFLFADKNSDKWQEGKVILLTDHGLGLRYVCESLDFHGP